MTAEQFEALLTYIDAAAEAAIANRSDPEWAGSENREKRVAAESLRRLLVSEPATRAALSALEEGEKP